jgi:hypothetical protein
MQKMEVGSLQRALTEKVRGVEVAKLVISEVVREGGSIQPPSEVARFFCCLFIIRLFFSFE